MLNNKMKIMTWYVFVLYNKYKAHKNESDNIAGAVPIEKTAKNKIDTIELLQLFLKKKHKATMPTKYNGRSFL